MIFTCENHAQNELKAQFFWTQKMHNYLTLEINSITPLPTFCVALKSYLPKRSLTSSLLYQYVILNISYISISLINYLFILVLCMIVISLSYSILTLYWYCILIRKDIVPTIKMLLYTSYTCVCSLLYTFVEETYTSILPLKRNYFVVCQRN